MQDFSTPSLPVNTSFAAHSSDDMHTSNHNNNNNATMQMTTSTPTRSTSSSSHQHGTSAILQATPHQGSLFRYQKDDEHVDHVQYVMEIAIPRDTTDVDEHEEVAEEAHDDDDLLSSSIPAAAPPPPPSQKKKSTHSLVFSRCDFEMAQRLFAILDTDNQGLLDPSVLLEFATLRCPVLRRRDEDVLQSLGTAATATATAHTTWQQSASGSPTFDEIWHAVLSCSTTTTTTLPTSHATTCLGVEGWMVFCRLLSLTQYLEAKRRFSARHRQQTMRPRKSNSRASEVVMVDVPPPEAPAPITPQALQAQEERLGHALPMPELDLDHSLLAARESARRQRRQLQQQRRRESQGRDGTASCRSASLPDVPVTGGRVRVELFGPSASASSSKSKAANALEFAITWEAPSVLPATGNASTSSQSPVVVVSVRRSMEDLKWLDETLCNHKALGGTLCGRILPPLGATKTLRTAKSGSLPKDESRSLKSLKSTTGAMAYKAAGKIKAAAKSWLGSYYLPSTSSPSTSSASPSEDQTPVTISSASSVASSLSSRSTTTAAASTASSLTAAAASAAAMTYQLSKKRFGSKNKALANFYNTQSPSGQARQLERYLNYLLEHPALCTSFALHTILKASQSGLDAAKQSLEECSRATMEIREQTPHLDDGGGARMLSSSPMYGSGGTFSSLVIEGGHFAWVRTAAQAAMALRVHGMLETTGMPSASARLQHASLPNFRRANGGGGLAGWEEEDEEEEDQVAVMIEEGQDIVHIEGLARRARSTVQSRLLEGGPTLDTADHPEGTCFEEGVIQVRSDLQSAALSSSGMEDVPKATALESDDGYDLLPPPMLAPERRILTAGSAMRASDQSDGEGDSSDSRQVRFNYGNGSGSFSNDAASAMGDGDARAVYLGNISVDANIDRLREVIGSVDSILSRCLVSSGGIGTARCERQMMQLDVMRGLDAWEGMRGKFISQRPLMKGVAGIEQSKDIYEESDLVIMDDMSWQTSLASAAVAAAEDVRSAVRVSRTAANAKAAASAAAAAAQNTCEMGGFSTLDEARAAQTRASIAQSHAIHAAVVDHEAKAAKRRATLALANDVKCWNVHRKREMLQSCLSYARSQHEATRRAVDAWSSLRDGFIGTTVIPTAPTDRRTNPPTRPTRQHTALSDCDEVQATLYGKIIPRDSPPFANPAAQPPVPSVLNDSQEVGAVAEIWGNATVPEPHIVAVDPVTLPSPQSSEEMNPPTIVEPLADSRIKVSRDETNHKLSFSFQGDTELILPFATASPIPEGDEEDVSATSSRTHPTKHYMDFDRFLGSGGSSHAMSTTLPSISSSPHLRLHHSRSSEADLLSASMQSLVDGLMTWDGGLDADEDHMALPAGMAASIVLEHSGALGTS